MATIKAIIQFIGTKTLILASVVILFFIILLLFGWRLTSVDFDAGPVSVGLEPPDNNSESPAQITETVLDDNQISEQPANNLTSSIEERCRWLDNNFPQSPEEVIEQFNLPNDTKVSFIFELCPSVANAFGVAAKTAIEFQVPDGGCIDSWSGFTDYPYNDVGTPVPDGYGGWRVYKGTVIAPEMTYRILGCP